MRPFETAPDSHLTLTQGDGTITVDLYSAEGVDLVNALYLKLAAEYKWMYQPTWLGRPIIQLPHDIVAMQELIWNVQPDFIVETGVAHGGSLILSASICELIGRGTVLGVDIEIRKPNRAAIEAHPMARRIELIEGSSTDEATIAAVGKRVSSAERTLIVLDSNHTHAHVLRELQSYCGFVTPGSYLVAMDGSQALVGDVPRARPDWKLDHPLSAIYQFLKTHPEFEIDPHYTRFGVTSSMDGFLRRKS